MIRSGAMGVRVATLAALLAVTACEKERAPEATPQADPQVVLHGVRMQVFRGGELNMIGRSVRLTYHRTSAGMTATEGLLRFPSRGREGVRAPGQAISGLEVRAPLLEGNLYGRQADAKGGVLMRTSSGMVGRTEAAHFDGVAMKLDGASTVTVVGPGYGFEADGFTMDFESGQFEFTGNTRTYLGSAQ